MRIKTKLVLGGILLASVPVVVATLIISYQSITNSHAALQDNALLKLAAVGETTAENIESYFSTIVGQIISFSHDRMIMDAMEEFKRDFSSFGTNIASEIPLPEQKRSLQNYYQNEFGAEFRKRNNARAADVDGLISQLSDNAVALQYAYISNNRHNLGEKDALMMSDDSSPYSTTHKKYHEHIRKYLEVFEYYDIFLVDHETGDIVYSVYKELDFSTSLKRGPYDASGLAKAFSRANQLTRADQFVIEDFAPYVPSYNAPAAFIASPIFRDGEKIGILIFQMPIDRINSVMTHGERWKEVGLGDTGETYLVGSDMKLRSANRLQLEDSEAYLAAMEKLADQQTWTELRSKGSGVGIQLVDTASVRAAINGESAVLAATNIFGEEAFSAYRPLKIANLEWVIVSEITQAEALEAAKALQREMLIGSIIVMCFAIAGGALGGLLVAQYIAAPISRTVMMLRSISEGGGDITQRMDEARRDEMGDLGRYFNLFAENIRQLISRLMEAAQKVEGASERLKTIAGETSTAIDVQHHQTEQIASAITEMTATIEEVARNTQEASSVALNTHETAAEGLRLIDENAMAIRTLSEEVRSTSVVVEKLAQESNSIGDMLASIEGIAGQTNLLALNAAIEAARAGESGRGFAVVADEVRSLAQKTQGSTRQIKDIIQRLQNGAAQVSDAMERSLESSNYCVQKSDTVKAAFDSIAQQIAHLNNVNMQIASAAEEQNAASNEINNNVLQIRDSSEDTTRNSEHVASASKELSALADIMAEMLKRYRV